MPIANLFIELGCFLKRTEQAVDEDEVNLLDRKRKRPKNENGDETA